MMITPYLRMVRLQRSRIADRPQVTAQIHLFPVVNSQFSDLLVVKRSTRIGPCGSSQPICVSVKGVRSSLRIVHANFAGSRFGLEFMNASKRTMGRSRLTWFIERPRIEMSEGQSHFILFVSVEPACLWHLWTVVLTSAQCDSPRPCGALRSAHASLQWLRPGIHET